MSTKVLLMDDHQIFRDGLKLLIDRQKSMEVVGEAGSGREAVQQAEKLQPDIIVMDGIEATKAICAAQPQARIIALSIYSEKIFVSEMLNAGAKGYLPKNAASDELIVAIKAVVGGKGYLSPLISGDVIDDYVRSLKSREMRKPAMLTLQEKEVLRLIALGCNSKVVAKRMKVKTHTVKAYRKRIMKKLDLGGIADLTKYAIDHHMLGND